MWLPKRKPCYLIESFFACFLLDLFHFPDRTVILPRYHFNRFSLLVRNTTLLLWAETLTPDISYFVMSMPAADFWQQ